MSSPLVDDAAEEVLAPLNTIHNRGFSRFDVFDDWVSLMLYSIQGEDEAYLDTLDRYKRGRDRDRGDRGDRNPDLFAEAFGELRFHTAKTGLDVLGAAYEQWGMHSDAFGQHWTPHAVCQLMARMQPPAADHDPDSPVTIGDPACGSGRQLVVDAKLHDDPVFCVGQDKDGLCARMTALNFWLFGIEGVAIKGDSIKVESNRTWRTGATPYGFRLAEVDPADVPYPEAAFETEDDADDVDSGVAADGGDLEDADLGEWSQ